ncbi:unnamed protein product [Rotaria socialis]|uniref:Pentapeptide repeat-containing protein n=1 Tax=Rotaria socialis TaxID=392032 RepID=A0A817Q5A9_9BILA|nr:unnamed protein product [Rotaria socialis]CAF3591659.1 unnamed protein product [Rotaria socialis]CAF4230882.1 unnamed protein product [Rotaria socialis]CAF4319055.1 unnamed protein product [Rotaria socialis]
MTTASPMFFDPSQMMPPPFYLPPPPAVPAPAQVPAPSKSTLLDLLKILVGLLIAIMIGALFALVLFFPRASNTIDVRESNEKIAKLLSESNEKIAQLQREQALFMETERQRRQENVMEKYRFEDRLIAQQRVERQISIENQRLERQYNLTEKHRYEDQLYDQKKREQDLIFALHQSSQQLEVEQKRLQILLEEKRLDEQTKKNDLTMKQSELLSEFMQEIMSTTQPINAVKFELKIHSLLRQCDSVHKSLLIQFLYKFKYINAKNSANPTLDLQGANLKNLRLDDLDAESGQIGRRLDYSQLSLPLTSLINASLEQIYFNEANFSMCNMAGTSFRSSQGIGADFYRANLSLTSFVNADVSQSNFSHATIERASFLNANLSQADMNNANLKSANLQFISAVQTSFFLADISSADFNSANLVQANLAHLSARSANFHSVKAMQANFSYASMASCVFQWADLSSASFQRAFLAGSNFENANVQDVDFTGAYLANATITPGQLAEALSIAQAVLPNGTIGRNRNLASNSDASCKYINGIIADWNTNGDVITKQEKSSTECVFEARKINATLRQNVNLQRFERVIKHGNSNIFLEMRVKPAGLLNSSTSPAYMILRFIDSNSNQINLEQSLADITWFQPPSTFTATIPCPATTTQLQVTIVFREAHVTADHIYVTVD